MKRKVVYFLILTLVTSLLFSCSKDEEGTERSYKFKDQLMQGEIEGEAWTFISGIAEIGAWEEDQLSLNFYAEASDDPCNEWLQGNQVFGNVPNAVGLYKFKLDLGGDDNQTITLFHQESFMNTIVSTGAIEITLIDLESKVVEGRIDAYGDKNNFVNGNFTLTLCQDKK